MLFSCQSNDLNDPDKLQGNAEVKAGDGFLDLSQFSLEQQKIELDPRVKATVPLPITNTDVHDRIEACSSNMPSPQCQADTV